MNVGAPYQMIGPTDAATRYNWLEVVKKNIQAEQTATLARSIVWYFGWPWVFFVVLAPGFLLSLPPAIDCDDGVRKPIAPERTTTANVFVHSALFVLLVAFMYWFGSNVLGIMFPFTFTTLKSITS
jgi:hypothetical protein